MKPLAAHDIRAAAQALDKVNSLDDTIVKMGRGAPDLVDEYGSKIRDIFGRNRLSQFRNSHLGEIVLCAIINALLDERHGIVEANKAIVEFPEPPCPRQEPMHDD